MKEGSETGGRCGQGPTQGEDYFEISLAKGVRCDIVGQADERAATRSKGGLRL